MDFIRIIPCDLAQLNQWLKVSFHADDLFVNQIAERLEFGYLIRLHFFDSP